MSTLDALHEEILWLTDRNQQLQDALLAVEPHRPIYHWSPADRYKQIVKRGLCPNMRETTSSGKVSYVCFGDTPSWAWALSGDMRYTPSGRWDLWFTWINHLTEPEILPDKERPSGIYEVRTAHRVFKSKLWHVGSRVKE